MKNKILRKNIILPSESLRLSLDDADESCRWFFMEDFWGNNKTSLLCNGGGKRGGVDWWKRCGKLLLVIVSVDVRFPFILIFTGRGGIGGGVEDILSDEALAPFVYWKSIKTIKYNIINSKILLDENFRYLLDVQ